MPKLKLTVNPTFKAKVKIPVVGGEAVDVGMTFKHRTRKEWDEWVASAKERDTNGSAPPTIEDEVNSFLDVVVGWELEDEFNRANVELLLQNYYTAGTEVVRTYASELWNSKLKNFER
jgi:hypothetical protein